MSKKTIVVVGAGQGLGNHVASAYHCVQQVADVTLADDEYVALTAALNKLKVYGERTDEQIAELGELRTKLYGSPGVHTQK